MADGKNQANPGQMRFTDFDVSDKGRPAALLDNAAASGFVSTLSNISHLASSLDFGFEPDEDETPPPQPRAKAEAAPVVETQAGSAPTAGTPGASPPRGSAGERDRPITPAPDSPPPSRAAPPREERQAAGTREPAGLYVPPALDAAEAVTTWRDYAQAFRRKRGPTTASFTPVAAAAASANSVPPATSPPPGGSLALAGAAAEAFKQLSTQNAPPSPKQAPGPDLPGQGQNQGAKQDQKHNQAHAQAEEAGDFDILSLLDDATLEGEISLSLNQDALPEEPGHTRRVARPDSGRSAEDSVILPTDWYDVPTQFSRDDPMAALLDLVELLPEHHPAGGEPGAAADAEGKPAGRSTSTNAFDIFSHIDLEEAWRDRRAAVETGAGAGAPGRVQPGGETEANVFGQEGRRRESSGSDPLDTRYMDLFGDVDLDSHWERKVQEREGQDAWPGAEDPGQGAGGNDGADTTYFPPPGFGKDVTTILSEERIYRGRGLGRGPASGGMAKLSTRFGPLPPGSEGEEPDALLSVARDIAAAGSEASAAAPDLPPDHDDELLLPDDGEFPDAGFSPEVGLTGDRARFGAGRGSDPEVQGKADARGGSSGGTSARGGAKDKADNTEARAKAQSDAKAKAEARKAEAAAKAEERAKARADAQEAAKAKAKADAEAKAKATAERQKIAEEKARAAKSARRAADAAMDDIQIGLPSGESVRSTPAAEKMRSRMERLRREYEAENQGEAGGKAGTGRVGLPEQPGGSADEYDPFEEAMPGSVGNRAAAADKAEAEAAAEASPVEMAPVDADGGMDYLEPAEWSGGGLTAEDLLNEGFDEVSVADGEVSAPVIDNSAIESGGKRPKPGTEEMQAIMGEQAGDGGDGFEGEEDFGETEAMKRRQAAIRDGGLEADDDFSPGRAEVAAEPAAGGGASDPEDIFASLDDMDFSDDMDDEMRAMLNDDGDAVGMDGEGGALGELVLDSQTAMPPLPKTGFRLLLSYVGDFLRRIVPMRYLEKLDRMVAWGDNWWFYCDLLAAIIASASLAVIISYYVWYKR